MPTNGLTDIKAHGSSVRDKGSAIRHLVVQTRARDAMATELLGRQRVMGSLKSLYLFSGCSAEDLAEVAAFCLVRRVGRGQRLYSEHDPCIALHYLSHGLVKLARYGSRGAEQIIDICGTGRLLGVTALFTGDGYQCDAVAVDECDVTVIQTAPLMRFLESHPLRVTRLATELGRAHARMVTRVENLLGRTALQRVALYLLESSDPEPDDHTPPPLVGCIRRADIANMLGLTPETFSRVLARFRKAGWILDQGGHVSVVRRERLHEAMHDPSVLRPSGAAGTTHGAAISA
ncbi:MAG: Crp/Fnr family transcriptional regulator [Planctomycetes bacterium]|nr:Crp/Fnr family transcriptional regulator [Planctomycetota bacterium]